MQITIRDHTYSDVNKRPMLKYILPKLGHEDGISGTTDGRELEPNTFVLMIEPDDTIAAVKAYIQEEKGISFKKQKLRNEDGGVLRDVQTLNSLGATDSYLFLRCAPTMRIIVKTMTERTLKLMVESDYNVADVKVAIQEKEGFRFHKQRLILAGRRLEDNRTLAEYNIQYDSTLVLVLWMGGC
ncbi:uncharacterized protein LOC142164047 [Nicotiana tabacum]|uniref:Uncharacterized protein LOC142164047 n=1 Tax=Nicotiana tabacum TaxID=4097 RepID=A0AC58RX46_TOBAC